MKEQEREEGGWRRRRRRRRSAELCLGSSGGSCVCLQTFTRRAENGCRVRIHKLKGADGSLDALLRRLTGVIHALAALAL